MRSTIKMLGMLPLYFCFRNFGIPVLLPLNYTLGVTYRCNSKCKTCNIWKIQQRIKPEQELSLSEWEMTLKDIGESPFWITLTGGEPFLRKDLTELVEIIDDYCRPKIINIPTNGILWRIIPRSVEEILNS
ncbi:MAG: 4Fe-4S cluster-binding domain-containing protein, partial [Candidatus Jordarchaeaceae archaeon]